MASDFPLSPRVRKGGLAAYRLPSLVPTIVIFQYNPDEVARSLRSQVSSGGGRGDSQRAAGPPEETLTFTVDIESPGSNATTVQLGLHPAIAALESLMYPPFSMVAANEALALAGMGFIAAEQAPLSLLVWGRNRVLPVRLESLAIKEQAFDVNLNPIRVTADLSLKVQSYRDLEMTNPGYWVYMASFAQKEVFATVSSAGNLGAVADLLPI
jgi:hypothetical protein